MKRRPSWVKWATFILLIGLIAILAQASPGVASGTITAPTSTPISQHVALSLQTDHDTYLDPAIPVIAEVTIYTAQATTATLTLALDDGRQWTHALNLITGTQALTFDLPRPIKWGPRSLKATLVAGGLTRTTWISFIYGSDAPDLRAHPVINQPVLTPTYRLEAWINNAGKLPAVASQVAFWDGKPGDGGTLIGEVTVPPLDGFTGPDAHDEQQVSLDWVVEGLAGTHTIYVVADASDVVSESDETNNVGSGKVIVPPFVVYVTTDQSTMYKRDAIIPITITVANLQPAVSLNLTTTTKVLAYDAEYYIREQTFYVPAGRHTSVVNWWAADEAMGGLHWVDVKAIDSQGQSGSETGYLWIRDSANFVASPLTGTVPLTVTFTDKSTPKVNPKNLNYPGTLSWQWDFGDGSPVITQINPYGPAKPGEPDIFTVMPPEKLCTRIRCSATHVYTRPGVYTATLTTTTPSTTYTETKPNYITATAPAVILPSSAADAPMVEVPAGQFVLGIDPTTAARHYAEWWLYNTRETTWPPHYSSAIPRLTVSLPAFAIDKLQVTNADYRRCVAARVCSPPAGEQVGMPQGYFDTATYADYPANVLWQQAATYCQWTGGRLPTEAEWEKAARGTDERRYPWGETWDESRVAMGIEPVGRHPEGASPYGALDMIGNLPEWTQDTFQYYPGNIEKLEHPEVESRVVRGEVLLYDMHGVDADASLRLAYADLTADAAGFRCVKGGAPASLAEVLVSYEPVLITVTPRSQVDLTGMVEVPAGEFIMGTPDDWVDSYKQDHQAEKPQHRVYLDAFYIDKYEVTNEQFAAFLNDLGRSTEACEGDNTCLDAQLESIPNAGGSMIVESPGRPKSSYRAVAGYERYPVGMVSWYGARTYCAWLGKRLPTEAEWEKAARGPDGRRYPWGNEWDSRVLTPAYPREIGLDPLNVSPYGAVDMLGNAGEWVSDWFDPAYYAVSPDRNPQGPAAPPAGWLGLKVLRSPNGSAVRWGLSARSREMPALRISGGVRCAYSAKQ